MLSLKNIAVKILAGHVAVKACRRPVRWPAQTRVPIHLPALWLSESISQGISGLCELPTTMNTGQRRQLFWARCA